MKWNKIILAFLLVSMIISVKAWTPPSDGNFRNNYAIYNTTNVTGANAIFTNLYGTLIGSFSIGANVNYNNYDLFNATNVNATNIYQNGYACLDTASSWTGDLSGTGLSPTVDDDSHNHGASTVTGVNASKVANMDLDCSASTYMTGLNHTDESITCTAIADVYLSNTGDTGTGAYVFTGGTFDVDTLNTGQGDNELYDMDQNVLTTSDVKYADINITGNATIGSGLIYWNGSHTIIT